MPILTMLLLLTPTAQATINYVDFIRGSVGNCTSSISADKYFSSPYSIYIETFLTGDYCYIAINEDLPELIDNVTGISYIINHNYFNLSHPSGAMTSLCMLNDSDSFLAITSSSSSSVSSWSEVDTVTGDNSTGINNNIWWLYADCDPNCQNCNFMNPLVGNIDGYHGGNFSQVKEYMSGASLLSLGLHFGVVGIYNGYGSGYIDNIQINGELYNMMEDYYYNKTINYTTKFNGSETTNFSNVTDWSSVNLTLDGDNGKISWKSHINMSSSNFNFDSNVNLGHRSISVSTSNMPELDASATLTFKDAGFTSIRQFDVYRNGNKCPTTICTSISISGSDVIIEATKMSSFSLIPTDPFLTTTTTLLVTILLAGGIFTFLGMIFTPSKSDMKELIYALLFLIIVIALAVSMIQSI